MKKTLPVLVIAGIAFLFAWWLLRTRAGLPQLPVSQHAVPGAVAEKPGPTPRLLDVATRVGDWETATFWLADGVVLRVYQGEYDNVARKYGPARLIRLNLAMGEEMTLTELMKLYNEEFVAQAPQPSPDGKWLLWTSGQHPNASIHAARLDGTRHYRVPRAKSEFGNRFISWLGDSRHFVELVTPDCKKFTHTILHDVLPGKVRTFSMLESSPLQAACCTTQDVCIAAGDRLVTLPGGRDGSYFGVRKALTIGQAVLDPQREEWCSVSTCRPPAESVMLCGLAVSPWSDRIGWLIARETKGGPTFVGLWVSRLDGSNWREIGCQKTHAIDSGFGEHLGQFIASAPGGLQWLPDGKHLSFRYDGGLYTVHVD